MIPKPAAGHHTATSSRYPPEYRSAGRNDDESAVPPRADALDQGCLRLADPLRFGERSEVVRTREIECVRFGGSSLTPNADTGPKVRPICKGDDTGRPRVRAAMQQLGEVVLRKAPIGPRAAAVLAASEDSVLAYMPSRPITGCASTRPIDWSVCIERPDGARASWA